MINRKISSRYSESLMDLAMEKNSLDIIYADVKSVIKDLEENSQLRRLLSNPVIKSNVKASILDEVFAGRISPDTQKFIRFLIDKNREDYLFEIMKGFLEKRNEKMGIVEVEVTTSSDFDEKQTLDLKNKLELMLNKKVELHFKIDKNILGGFIARIGDTLYDASIRNQLNNLKKVFLQGNTFN